MVSPGVAAPTPSLFSAAIRASRRPSPRSRFSRYSAATAAIVSSSAHLFSYPVGLPLLLLEKAEQVDLLVFGRCCPLCV